MQKFTYHSHTNSQGIYDGHNSAEEMINKAEELGFTEIGVSNHLIFHPNVAVVHKMFFNDTNKALDAFKVSIEEIHQAASRHKIKVLVGAEVDYFPSADWNKSFEKARQQLDLDYMIGSTHTIRSADERSIYNIYHLDLLPPSVSQEGKDELLKNYWLNIVASINSGYFDFIAHIDYCNIFNLGVEPKWDEYKWMIIEALVKNKQAFELNTSGYNNISMQHPHTWMLSELAKRDVPIVISDDSHNIDAIGQHFERAESLLSSLNYTNRFKLDK